MIGSAKFNVEPLLLYKPGHRMREPADLSAIQLIQSEEYNYYLLRVVHVESDCLPIGSTTRAQVTLIHVTQGGIMISYESSGWKLFC
jgi:hypothetical protein